MHAPPPKRAPSRNAPLHPDACLLSTRYILVARMHGVRRWRCSALVCVRSAYCPGQLHITHGDLADVRFLTGVDSSCLSLLTAAVAQQQKRKLRLPSHPVRQPPQRETRSHHQDEGCSRCPLSAPATRCSPFGGLVFCSLSWCKATQHPPSRVISVHALEVIQFQRRASQVRGHQMLPPS